VVDVSELVIAVSSTAEIVETTLELSINRMNWLASAGYTVFNAGKMMMKRKICRRFKPSARGLDLTPGDGLDAGAHDLAGIGAKVNRHRGKRGGISGEADADHRQREIKDEDLDQEGRVADQLDIGRHQPAHRPRPCRLAAGAKKREAQSQSHRRGRKSNGQQRAFEQLRQMVPDDVELKDVIHVRSRPLAEERLPPLGTAAVRDCLPVPTPDQNLGSGGRSRPVYFL
jgi:hypothetical protein